MLLMMAGAYLWTEFGMGNRWSWMLCLGKTSLMVYWVHVMLVYGDVAKPLKRALSIPETALATLLVTLSMVALAAAWLWWKAGGHPQPLSPLRARARWLRAVSVSGSRLSARWPIETLCKTPSIAVCASTHTP